jgi:hypothetical protein
MLRYFKTRSEYFIDCWKHAKNHWSVSLLVLLSFVYSLLLNWGPVIQLGDWADTSKWPKLPLPWALFISSLGLLFITLEGGYRLRTTERRAVQDQANCAETKTQEVRRKQIEVLTGLIERGQEIIRRCRTEREIVPEADATTWANDAENEISGVFDSTFIPLFRSGVGIPMGAAYWPNLENRHVDGFVYVRVYRLQSFVDQLRAMK